MKDHDITTITCDDIAKLASRRIRQTDFLFINHQGRLGLEQPHLTTRLDLRVKIIAELRDDELLDSIIKQNYRSL